MLRDDDSLEKAFISGEISAADVVADFASRRRLADLEYSVSQMRTNSWICRMSAAEFGISKELFLGKIEEIGAALETQVAA